MSRIRNTLDVFATLVMLCTAGVMLWVIVESAPDKREPPGIPVPEEPIAIPESTQGGNPHARIGVVIFSDFQCPYCARFAQGTWPELKREFVDSGQMLVSFRHLPLTRIHPQAWRAAEAAECAAAQGRFWQMHDEAFAAQADLSDSGLRRMASRAGVREELYDSCMVDRSSSARVSEDAELARRLGFVGTPIVVVGLAQGEFLTAREVLVGATSIDEMRAAVSRLGG